MKIVLSNYRYFVSGGPETYMFAIQDVLREYGHEVVPFSVRSARNVPNAFESEFLSPVADEDSAYFYEYKKNLRTVPKILARQFYSPEAFVRARSFASVHKPDIVYSLQFMSKMSPSVLDGFKSSGVPVVLRVSDFSMICPQGHLFDGQAVCNACVGGNFLHAYSKRCIMDSGVAGLVKGSALFLHRLLRCRDRIDAFVFPSRFTLGKFVEAGFPEAKLHYIPTPIDTSTIVPSYVADGPILYFGRLVVEKGVHHLLQAYRGIAGKKPKLVLVGAQATTPYAKALMDEYPEVSFHDFVTKNKLARYIQAASVVVIPSLWYDNLPNVLLEAFAHGKAVVAPEHGSFVDLVSRGHNGLLFKPGDSDSLRDALGWTIQHPDEIKQMGRNARLFVEELFSPSLHYKRLITLFQHVLN